MTLRLDTPEARAAYRRELNAVARAWRLPGMALALIGAAMGAARFFVTPFPDALRWTALFLCTAGVLMLAVGLVIRTRHHLRRISGR